MLSSWQDFLATLSLDEKPQALLPEAVCPLTQYRFLEVSGPEAEKFLQGQLSCDISQLQADKSGLGSHNNAKGRMLSSFRICLLEEHRYLLRVHESIAEAAKAALAKYIVFSKADIRLLDDVVAVGLHGQQAAQNLQQLFPNIPTARYGQSRSGDMTLLCTSAELNAFEIYGKADDIQAIWPNIAQDMPVTDYKQQQLVEHHEGLAFVEQASAESQIPQMFNYQALPAVSFKKGCYTGQEIVARMQYLGKLKRHLYHCKADIDQAVHTGDELFVDQQAQSVGMVASCTPIAEDQTDLLLVLSHHAASADTLLTRSATLSGIEQLPLPYHLEQKVRA